MSTATSPAGRLERSAAGSPNRRGRHRPRLRRPEPRPGRGGDAGRRSAGARPVRPRPRADGLRVVLRLARGRRRRSAACWRPPSRVRTGGPGTRSSALPVAWALAVVGVAIALGDPAVGVFDKVFPAIVIVPLLVLIPAFAEEIAWRGYAVTRLLPSMTPLAAALLLGVPWAVIHLFLQLPGQMNAGLDWWPTIVSLLGYSVILTWAFVGSGGSVLLVALVHAGLNGVAPLMAGLDVDRTWIIRALVTASIALAIVVIGGSASAGSPPAGRHAAAPSGRAQRRSPCSIPPAPHAPPTPTPSTKETRHGSAMPHHPRAHRPRRARRPRRRPRRLHGDRSSTRRRARSSDADPDGRARRDADRAAATAAADRHGPCRARPSRRPTPSRST